MTEKRSSSDPSPENSQPEPSPDAVEERISEPRQTNASGTPSPFASPLPGPVVQREEGEQLPHPSIAQEAGVGSESVQRSEPRELWESGERVESRELWESGERVEPRELWESGERVEPRELREPGERVEPQELREPGEEQEQSTRPGAPSWRDSRPSMRPSEPSVDPLDELAAPRPGWQMALLVGGVSLLAILLLAALSVVLVINHYSKELPDVRQLEQGYAPPQVTRVLARDKTLLANIFSERRTVVPYERIPDHVKSAFLAAEDAGFFEHEGLDYLGMLRAVVINLREGRVRQGGSTITQQVVKNVLLSHERSYERKIGETILAYRLEKSLTKDKILGMYMNHIYLGHGRYGVEEAARYYFGKKVQQLDVPEGALLAGIVASPERYSPRRDQEKALARRRYVLTQMLDKGFMTKGVFDASVKEPVRLSPVAETESDIAPEMIGHASHLLETLQANGAQKGGYTIHTTIDPELQVEARAAVRRGLDDYLKRQKLAPPFTLENRRLWGPVFEGMPRRHGIYVGTVEERRDQEHTIMVRVGKVLGVVALANEERYNPTHLPPSEFVGKKAALRVRVLDDPEQSTDQAPVRLRLELGPQAALLALHPRTREVLAAVGSYEALPGGLDRTVQSKRQPGSTFKPLVYSYALNTHQVTAATHFQVPRASEKGAPDASALEELSLREGIARSDNRVALQVLREVGPTQALEWAKALGITSQLGADESLMLGAYEVTVAEMAAAFSVFASGGTALDPLFISRLESGAGDLSLPPRSPERKVMDPAVAYLTTSLLSSVIESGTGQRARSLDRPVAGKTGTTNKAKDAWFVGYSTDLVTAVWVGFDDALPLGWGESGATSALPIWMDFMKAAHRDKPATEFPRPSTIVEVEIDPGTGLLARYGQEDASTEVFLPGTVPEQTAPAEEDAVVTPPESEGTLPDAVRDGDLETAPPDQTHVETELPLPAQTAPPF